MLAATPAADDPVALLQAAARDHIPVNPDHKGDYLTVDETGHMPVPSPEDRASVHDILVELEGQRWYKDQIVERRTIDAREGQTGSWLIIIDLGRCLMFAGHSRPTHTTTVDFHPASSKKLQKHNFFILSSGSRNRRP